MAIVRISVCAAVLLVLGCGRSDTGLISVQGRVFHRGRPLAGGTIVFTPDGERGCRGPQAWGQIDAEGRYRLSTDGQMGAIPGWHRVTVAAAAEGRLPSRYRDPELSGQRYEVRPDRANVFDLHLE